MFKTASALTAGRIFNMFVSVTILLIQSHYIGPETTGFVGLFAIPLGYLWILTLGIPSALARELPYYLARGEHARALKLTQTANSFSVVMGLFCSISFAVLTIVSLIMGNYLHAMGWAFQIVSSFFVIYSSYNITLFRTNDQFVEVAKSNTIAGITQLIVFPLIFINPILGLFIKSIASTVTANIFLYFKRPFKHEMGFGFDFQCFKELFKFGLPILLIGYLEANLWLSAQSTIIVTRGSVTYLGLFNFVNQILMALLIIPGAVTDILRPKFAAIYGKTDGDIRQTLKVAIKPLLLTLTLSIFVIVLSWLFVGDIIRWLLPKYAAAIPALDIALLIVPIMTIKCIKYIFVVSKNLKFNLLSTAPGFIVGLSLLYTSFSYKVGFKYIFLPYLVGQTLNLIISVVFLLGASKRKVSN